MNNKLWLFGGFLLVSATLVLLGAALPELVFRPAIAYPFETHLRAWTVLFGMYLLALVALVLLFRPRLRMGPTKAKPPSLLSILLQVVLWLVVLYLLRNRLQPLAPMFATPGEGGALQEVLDVAPHARFSSYTPDWLVLATGMLIGVGLLSLAYLLIRRRPKRIRPLVKLAHNARQALEELQRGGELHDVILRCYAEMCAALEAQRGVLRPQASTPREFQNQLLALGLPAAPVSDLTGLFERARYSRLVATTAEQENAIACVTAILDAIVENSK